MTKKWIVALVSCLSCGCLVSHAGTVAPFGVLSAFNLVALGTVNTSGQTVIDGNISTSADVEGRIAAANWVTQATTIGSTLGSDPYGSLAGGYALVAGGGVSAGNYFQINGGGNVWAASNSANYNWNENPRGTLTVGGTSPSPIDFAGVRTTMDAESLQLASLTASGTVTLGTGSNPSWLVLSGTSKTLNVFTLTAAQFASTNNNIDIQVPVGSTVIINVQGTNVTLGTGIYFNGNQESDSNNDGGDILFNFADATSVAIDGQFDGALLAPFATLTGGSQMGGTFIAAEIGQTGEVHNDEFTGTLPPTTPPDLAPEPGTLTLMGTGILLMVGLLRRFKRA
jgi:choice-of-anchor A domain-containing protein